MYSLDYIFSPFNGLGTLILTKVKSHGVCVCTCLEWGGGGGGDHANINLYRHADLILFHGELIPPFLITLQNR